MKKLLVILAVTIVSCVPLSAHAQGTLIVCDDTAPPRTLDPMKEFSEKNHTVVQQIYDGLVRFDDKGDPVPALAERWEFVEGEPSHVRFHLRRNVRFHNNEPFNAEAVKFSIERYKLVSPARDFLSHIRVEVIDEQTVDLVTYGPDGVAAVPDGLLLNRLAGFVLIVPPVHTATSDDALDQHPYGTGAFEFVGWGNTKGTKESLKLRANLKYWNPGFPKLDTLVFRFASAEEQVDLLLKGEVDLVTELPGTLTRQVMESNNAKVLKHQTYWTIGALINNEPGTPLADVRVRRALNLALDRADLIRYDVRGNGSILASLTMDGQDGHNPDLKPYPYDPEEATRLLDEAGVERPLKLRAHVRAESERAAKIIASHLAKVGVELELNVFNDAQVLESLDDPSQHWDFGIAGMPDPMCHSYFIQSVLLYSKSPYSLLKDEEFDRRLEVMASTVDANERGRLGRELDRYVYDQSLSLFTYQKTKTYGIRRSGVEFKPYISGMPYFFDAVNTK